MPHASLSNWKAATSFVFEPLRLQLEQKQSFLPGHNRLNSSSSKKSKTLCFISSGRTFPIFGLGSAKMPITCFALLAFLTKRWDTENSDAIFSIDQLLGASVSN